MAGGGPSTAPAHRAAAPNAAELRRLVHDASAALQAVDVRRGPEGYAVSAWWTLNRKGHLQGAIATSDDGFASAHYEPGSRAGWARHNPPVTTAPPPALAAFRGLVTSPVASLDPRTRAFVGGGDGATLLPFDVVARSTHGGRWRAYVVPRTHGDRAYDDGDLVLPDGRLLVLLDAWSSDRGPARPGPEHHGLWTSAGDDWASYAPYRPVFSPVLGAADAVAGVEGRPAAGSEAPSGLVVATTRANLLYVSTDGARSFRRIRAR